MNFQQSGRELLTPDEVRLLDNRKAVLLVRGERPILDEKYDLCSSLYFLHLERISAIEIPGVSSMIRLQVGTAEKVCAAYYESQIGK